MILRFLRTRWRALLADPEALRAFAVSSVGALFLLLLLELWLRYGGR